MRCGPPANVTMMMIGLHQVGITGLRDALKELDRLQEVAGGVSSAADTMQSSESPGDLAADDAVLDFLERRLAELNYVPTSQSALYRRALWREYVRYRGGDIRPFFSEIDVEVRGDADDVRDRFITTLRSVFGDFELQPMIELVETSDPDGRRGELPALVIEGTVVVSGLPSRERFKAAVRKTISDW